jgi:transmembrane sensor
VSDPSSLADPDADALAEAAQWFVLLASGEATDADRERWRAWRAEDARNEAGWRRAESATALFAQLPAAHAQTAADVLGRRATSGRGRRRVIGGMLAALIGSVAGWQGWRRSDLSADHCTAVGEMRDVVLADGSVLQMDTDTAIEIDFTARARLVVLRRGRVLISTGHPAEAAPPFFAVTAEGRVEALGTRFSVRQQDGWSEVGVLESRVAIHPAAAIPARGPALLHAGQFARFDRAGVTTLRALGVADNAWSRGMLIADAMTLSDFAAELARYRRAPILVSPEVADWRISGTFPLADSVRALAALAATLPVRVLARDAGDPAAGHLLLPASPGAAAR